MQFSALRTYAATRFRDAGNVVVTDAQWKDYINDAYQDVLSRCTWFPWNEVVGSLSFAINAQSMPMPTDAWQLLAVFNQTDTTPMFPLEGRDQVYLEYPDLSINGSPMHYRLSGNTLYVYPKPAAATTITIEYIKRPADLNLDADVPAFPGAYHSLLVSGALALAYTDDGNTNMAQVHAADFESGIKALIHDLTQPRNPRYYEPTDSFMF